MKKILLRFTFFYQGIVQAGSALFAWFNKYVNLFIVLVVLSSSCFLSCKKDKDDIPETDETLIPLSYIQGGWKVVDSHVYWQLSSFGTTLNKTYNIKKQVADKLKEETTDVSIFFNSSKAFYVRHHPEDEFPYVRQSDYTLNAGTAGNEILFSESDLLTFYAPKLYMKRNEADTNALTLYLRRAEMLDMMKEDADISKTYMNMIRSNLNDAVVEIYLERDTLPVYEWIIDDYGL